MISVKPSFIYGILSPIIFRRCPWNTHSLCDFSVPLMQDWAPDLKSLSGTSLTTTSIYPFSHFLPVSLLPVRTSLRPPISFSLHPRPPSPPRCLRTARWRSASRAMSTSRSRWPTCSHTRSRSTTRAAPWMSEGPPGRKSRRWRCLKMMGAPPGTANCSTSWLRWASLWAWGTCGASLTCARRMEEVSQWHKGTDYIAVTVLHKRHLTQSSLRCFWNHWLHLNLKSTALEYYPDPCDGG